MVDELAKRLYILEVGLADLAGIKLRRLGRRARLGRRFGDCFVDQLAFFAYADGIAAGALGVLAHVFVALGGVFSLQAIALFQRLFVDFGDLLGLFRRRAFLDLALALFERGNLARLFRRRALRLGGLLLGGAFRRSNLCFFDGFSRGNLLCLHPFREFLALVAE